jgi:general secretion pathway protein I
MMRRSTDCRRPRGFTLIEVLVALVIVAFGMGAVLSALSAAAVNVSALREKTLAQWVALNRIADVRLDLQPPQVGTSEGDVQGFANGNWHWQQIVSNVQEIPGLIQITVRVRRTATNTSSSSGGIGGSRSGIRTTTSVGSGSSGGKDVDWLTTVIGFRGTSIAAASGEVPDWSGASSSATSGSSGSSSSSGGSIANPGTSITPGGLGSSGPPSLGPTTPSTPTVPGNSSSGGP